MTALKPALPVSPTWFRSEPITDSVTRIEEPHVNELIRANIWHVRGRDRDLVVDSGLGVASLRVHLPQLFANNPILVITHSHLDHSGSAHEFVDRRAHQSETMDQPVPASLYGPQLADLLGIDWPEIPDWLLEARPSEDFHPDQYAIPSAPITSALQDGQIIDLGDKSFVVMHLPGHTPGSICLFNQANGELFSGDVLYDDALLDELKESNIEDYVRSMRRLRQLPATVVYGGHGPAFSHARMTELIDAYLLRRAE